MKDVSPLTVVFLHFFHLSGLEFTIALPDEFVIVYSLVIYSQEKITSLNIMGKPKSQRSDSQSNGGSDTVSSSKQSAFSGIGDDDL